ncbi:hypothetical protein ABVT43_10295 [Aliikangiella sp. GXAS 311]|uniref:DUF4345 domain-containing protein n=3 Tax=Aliikangiella maris TaxID=3162458 RepID=A0ABV2BVE7_9GAMM
MLSPYNLLRLLLLGAGLGWGLTVIGAVLPWEFAVEHLQKFGGSGPIPDDKMLNYWLRMASGAFGIIGLLFLLAAKNPQKYANIIPILGFASVFEGIILLFYGIMFDLRFFPFVVDLSIAFVPGIGILMFKNSIHQSVNSTTNELAD